MNHIGKLVKQFRVESGISQKKLATRLGITDKAISSYESGRTIPSIEILSKIAKQLNRPITMFFDTTGESSFESKIYNVERKVTEVLEALNEMKATLKK